MSTRLANPVRGRFNAAFFRLADGYLHHVLGDRKSELFRDLPDTVVEIGPGTGASLRYYRPGTRLVAVEPNVHMHAGLRAGASRRGVALEVLAVGAEDTGLATASVDAVVCTLVLCTVPDPAQVLQELRRVLRPGGRLLLLEHVAAPARSWRGVVQRLLRPAWSWVFEGCDLRRTTAQTVRDAGFADVDLAEHRARSLFVPVNSQVMGYATAG